MRLILGVFATLFAFAALSMLSLVVDAASKSLALAAAEISYTYTLQAGVSYTLTVDKYGFQTLTVSGSPGGSYAQLALSVPSGYAAFAEPGQLGNLLCNYVANSSQPLLQRCAVYINATSGVRMPVYYLRPGYTYLLEPGVWKIAVVRDPHSVWMPPPAIFPILAFVLLIAAFAWHYLRS